MENRYVVTLEMFIYARNDHEAIKDCKILANYIESDVQDTCPSNGCNVVSIVEQPYATIGNRPVYKP